MCTHHLHPDSGVAFADDDGSPASAPRPSLVEDLVCANRILFDQGILDAFGHVSVRHDKDALRFLLARNTAPGTVKVEDIIEFTLDSVAINAGGRPLYLERFIHGEIYKARPDVQAIVHSHSPTVLPFSVAKSTKLRPLCHMSGFLGAGTPIFEIRETAGDATDLLISDNSLGGALAAKLGSAAIVLMRGHGSTVVAPTLRQAVYRAVYAEINARMQIQAMPLGDLVYLSEREAMTACANIETQADRAWDLWKERART